MPLLRGIILRVTLVVQTQTKAKASKAIFPNACKLGTNNVILKSTDLYLLNIVSVSVERARKT